MKKYYTFFIFFIFLLPSCIDQIDLQGTVEEPLFVIDGLFTDMDENQTIKISKSIDVSSQIPNPVSGAEVFVEDQDGNRIAFIDQDNGNYSVKAKAEKGKQYRLFAILPDGRKITSNLQNVPDPFPIDVISFVDTLVTFTDESGDKRRIHSLDFRASAAVNSVENDMFLRFSHEAIYQLTEIMCNPFISADTCYIYDDVPPLEVNLLKIDKTEGPVQYDKFVYRRKIDTAMGEVFVLSLSLYSYNEQEYEYWEKLKLVFNQDGGINNSMPARLKGNITAEDGTEVQGQFAVVGKSRKIKLVANSDFPTIQLPFCGIAGFRPVPTPEECCSCILVPGATSNKPEFWP